MAFVYGTATHEARGVHCKNSMYKYIRVNVREYTEISATDALQVYET